jgi:SAM-dependent methyltransferase
VSPSQTWQLELGGARRYAEILVPAILGPFARALATEAEPGAGDAVADVGCGTGAAAQRAAELVGATGSVVALDVSPAMLEVARALPAPRGAPIEWREAPAEQLPLPDAAVDLVLCAQALQFVQDRERALREVRRIARPGARIAISTWCSLGENPYFAAVVQALSQLSPDAPAGLLAAFSLSDPAELRRLHARAALPEPALSVHEMELELPAPEVFVPLHLEATPLAKLFEEAPGADRRRLVECASELLAPWSTGNRVRVPFRSWFAITRL